MAYIGDSVNERQDKQGKYGFILLLLHHNDTESWKKGKEWKKWVFIWEALFAMKEKVQEILRPKKFNIMYKIWEYMPLCSSELEYILKYRLLIEVQQPPAQTHWLCILYLLKIVWINQFRSSLEDELKSFASTKVFL